MTHPIGLSQRDAQRLQRALRFVEDVAMPQSRMIRRVRGQHGGGGGTQIIYAQVVESLQRQDLDADPPVPVGISTYTLHLMSEIDASVPEPQNIVPWHISRGDVDFRHFVPWYEVGDVVPLVRAIITEHSIEPKYYIVQQLTYIGDCHPSIMWIDSATPGDGEMHAVFA